MFGIFFFLKKIFFFFKFSILFPKKEEMFKKIAIKAGMLLNNEEAEYLEKLYEEVEFK